MVLDKFMPELHLWDPKVKKYSACGPFTNHIQRINQFMKDWILSHLYKNQLNKACFHLNRAQSDVFLKNKAYKIAVDP